MEIRKQKIDVSEVRKILIQSITNDNFLEQLHVFADPNLLEDSYSRKILKWCFEYYEQFEEAPKQMIQSIYEQKSANLQEEESDIIEEILASVSTEYVNGNIDYFVESAENYFNRLALEKMCKLVTSFTKKGKIEEAVYEVQNFRKLERSVPKGVDLLESDEAIKEAFNEEEEELFKLPGVLGEALGSFNRGDLSAVMSPQKRGKSWCMIDIAGYAMQMGLNVWCFSFEMTQNQIIRRIWQQWLNKPRRQGEHAVPYFDEYDNIQSEMQPFEGIDVKEALKMRRLFKSQMRDSRFKIFAYPKNSFKVSKLKLMIENSILYDNELPDLIVLDYADIMCPERHGEKRHELDQIWGDLSAICEQYNIHILTGSQTNRATLTRDIEQSDLAEAQAKSAHVSKMFALNQTNANKEQHLIRYATMFNRHDEFLTNKQVGVLQNLACGKSMIDSRWVRDIKNIKKEERKEDE